MFALYQFSIGLLFWLSFPFLLVFVLITGRHRRGLYERLGLYGIDPAAAAPPGRKRIWIHAASIGEVRAAKVLIEQLQSGRSDLDFVVTTMTIHGRDFGRDHWAAWAAVSAVTWLRSTFPLRSTGRCPLFLQISTFASRPSCGRC